MTAPPRPDSAPARPSRPWKHLAQKVLAAGIQLTSGQACRWKNSSRADDADLFGLGMLVVYLTLSAQYESFVLPFIVLLAVPMALLGALGAHCDARIAE